ncbi:MAG: nitroreductase family protein [Armatimonadetes bacterium]|nr:nitroreductase family protein [Armatimonadota bacterium]
MEATAQSSVSQAAHRRVSIRKYTDRPIPRETIDAILTTASKAPSPWNVQPWRVIVVTQPETKQKLMEAAFNQAQVGAAAAVFVVYSDMRDALADPIEFIHPGMGDRRDATRLQIQQVFENMGEERADQWGFAESNIFLGYLLLAIEEHNLGSSPMLGFDAAKVKELFGLPEHVTLPAIVAVGEKAEEGFPQFRHELSRFVTYI